MKNTWIRTNFGHAGRNGYILRVGTRLEYRTYLSPENPVVGKTVAELKALADG